jgi:ribosomal protein S18
MLRRLVHARSLVTWLHEAAGQPGSILRSAPAMQLTSLRGFSAEGPSSPSDDTPAPPRTTKTAPTPPTSGATPTAQSLQNAKLWRQWVDGRIDERHRVNTYAPGGSAPGPARPGATAGATAGGKPTYRPKDPAKDWKQTSRSLRSSQERIASLLAADAEPSPDLPGGKYGILGTAADAPRLVPGAAAKAEETSPERLLPHRLFYPGATYSPDELDPYKAKPIGLLSDLNFRRGVISPKAVAVHADFRNPLFLNNFISDAGKLQPRRRTRLSAKAHRELARHIKLSRQLALMCPTAKIRPPPRPRGYQGSAASAGGRPS